MGELAQLPSVDDMLSRINAKRERMEEDPEYLQSLVDPHPSGNPIALGRRIPTPEDIADLQVKGVKDNKGKWLDRVTHPKKNFKEEALKPDAVARYKESMQRVIDQDLHRGGMELVNESEAIETIKSLGADHYAKAVEARKGKILRVAKELDADRLALASEIDEMDTVTDDDREAKMIANKRGLQAIGRKRRGAT